MARDADGYINEDYAEGLEQLLRDFMNCAKYDALPVGPTFTGLGFCLRWNPSELARTLNRAKQFTREWW